MQIETEMDNAESREPQIIFLVFYFGKFPSYFPLFLQSCKRNPDITWRIYTDANRQSEWPDNVEYRQMNFEDCRKRFRDRLGIEISLNSPKKLCDFKPAYGYIAEDDIKGYDYWGHCDLDMVFGCLPSFFPEDVCVWDKIGALGSLTIYRNDPIISRAFMMDVDGKSRWEEVFSSSRIFAFDEWGTDTINTIFDSSGFTFYKEPIVADIWPEGDNFRFSSYVPETGRYAPVSGTEGIFHYKDGRLFHLRMEGQRIARREVSCIHLQKREMRFTASESGGYYILPGRICPDDMPEKDAVVIGSRKHYIERQWLKIKCINLANRLMGRRGR